MPEQTTVKTFLDELIVAIKAIGGFAMVEKTPVIDIEEVEKTGAFPACLINHEGGQRELHAGKRYRNIVSTTVVVSLPTGNVMNEAEDRVLNLLQSLEDAGLHGSIVEALSLVEDTAVQSVSLKSGRTYVFASLNWRYTIRR